MTHPNWHTFHAGAWRDHADVRDFIVRNYVPYDGDEAFLAPPTERTLALWGKLKNLLAAERLAGGVLDIDAETVSAIDAYAPGYIDRDLEDVVGMQTDAPLKRAILPFGGVRMVKISLAAYGRALPPQVAEIFKYRKTHNDGVFDAYTPEMKQARRSGVITGLPDSYGRGRIIGDYRR
ncbi:MAG: formate acetyltransferase, partial [Firmicutes bacterium]|nr:formate acetyltransferase [Bacillota bacterium]